MWEASDAPLILARFESHAWIATALSKALAFLHKDVDPAFYWWELTEMVRKLWLIGFLVVIQPGSLLQLVLGTSFAFIYLVVQMQAMPYVRKLDAFLAVAVSGCLCAFFLICAYFKFASLTEVRDVQDVMTPNQRRCVRGDRRHDTARAQLRRLRLRCCSDTLVASLAITGSSCRRSYSSLPSQCPPSAAPSSSAWCSSSCMRAWRDCDHAHRRAAGCDT